MRNQITWKSSRSKYHNQKTRVFGITFDSRHEADRYVELRKMEIDGKIFGLRMQVPYVLVPSQKDEATGRVAERPLKYVADFVYQLPDGRKVVEDAKGCRTEGYKIKRKLMRYFFGIEIKEV